jgi:hypothetical protein
MFLAKACICVSSLLLLFYFLLCFTLNYAKFGIKDLLDTGHTSILTGLMVIQNTLDHVLPSTVLEKICAFSNLAWADNIKPGDLETFYAKLRGNITSNHFLECAFHLQLASALHSLKDLPAFRGIPTSSLKLWTRAGPNDCHASGVSALLPL